MIPLKDKFTYFFSQIINMKNLPKDIYTILQQRQLSIATGESCTSGYLANLLTDISGSSSFMKGSIVAYQEQVKIRLLSIPKELIKKHSVYSHQVATAMSEKIREIFQSDISMATTGLAGPTGGTEKNPVGSIYLAINIKGHIHSFHHVFQGERKELKKTFSYWALECLLYCLEKDL